jgi:phospholipid-transporting ATPase
LGATAIEDKLQKDVPETIATLREANMKVWVLTGDKLETAVNIGYASKQLVGGMDIMTISDQATITDVQRKVSEFCGRMDRGTTERHAALVIDGKSLSFALDSTVEKDFLNLALSCKSVICCRVSPLQKAEVVTLVRTNVKDSITLAIGDGANDVSMIQAAHIGVGISGREGLQATLASDYAISQFRFLAKLLLVHGAWNYRRLANVILYSFYKNICLYMIEFWFAFLNGFSGQPLFERWTIGLYNILFTLLAPIALGILDQDVSASTRLAQPHLYKTSQQNSAFNTKMFWKWVFLSLFHSAVLFYAVYFLLWHETPFENGQVFGIWYVGNTVYTAVVVTVNVKAAMVTQYWTPLTHVAIWGSIAAWFLYVLVYSHFWPTFPLAVEFVGQDFKLFTSFTFYGLFVLAPAVASLPEFMYIVFQKTLCPTSVDRAIVADVEGRGGKMIERDREMGLSVSYSVSSGSSSYGDGMDPGEAERALTYKHGYAFSQEDHGSLMKGTFVQRRDLVRFYDTQKGHTH